MASPNIVVTYVGRYAADWVPHNTPIASHLHSPRQTDDRFKAFVARTLEEAKHDDTLTPACRAERIKLIHAILERAEDTNGCINTGLDPNASPDDLERYYRYFLTAIINDLQSHLVVHWGIRKGNSSDDNPGKPKDNDDGKVEHDGKDDKNSKPTERDAADKRAQRVVPRWYGNKCLLTGTARPKGCHILPVRAKYANHVRTWDLIKTFCDIKAPEDVFVQGKEHENVLPLTQTAHALFDGFYFALRPIEHPQTPSTRVFVQVVYLRTPEGERITSHWDHRRFGGLYDFRRIPNPRSPTDHQREPENECHVQHGDVYELVTDDPDAHPLPSHRLLQVQFAAHTLMSGMRAAAALKDTFSGTPPPDAGGSSSCTSVPALWQDLIDEAQVLGILDEGMAARWGSEFARQAQQDAEDKAAFEAAYLESLRDDDSLFGERDDQDNPSGPEEDQSNKGKGADNQDNNLR